MLDIKEMETVFFFPFCCGIHSSGRIHEGVEGPFIIIYHSTANTEY